MNRPTSSFLQLGRALVDALPAPAQGRVRDWLGHPGIRTVPLDSLEAELSHAAQLFSSKEDDARSFLQGFQLELPGNRPPDPFSIAYRDWTWSLYHAISGRSEYSVANEASPIDLERATV